MIIFGCLLTGSTLAHLKEVHAQVTLEGEQVKLTYTSTYHHLTDWGPGYLSFPSYTKWTIVDSGELTFKIEKGTCQIDVDEEFSDYIQVCGPYKAIVTGKFSYETAQGIRSEFPCYETHEFSYTFETIADVKISSEGRAASFYPGGPPNWAYGEMGDCTVHSSAVGQTFNPSLSEVPRPPDWFEFGKSYDYDYEGSSYDSSYSYSRHIIVAGATNENKETIDIKVEPSEIKLKYNKDQTAIEGKPQAEVTITVKRGGEAMKGEMIVVKVCTQPGTIVTDGHIGHDKRVQGWEGKWWEECKQGTRPFAELVDKEGLRDNIRFATTDDKGQVVLTYESPKVQICDPDTKKCKNFYVAGTDEITATSFRGYTDEQGLPDPPKLQGKATIETKVPGLHPIPGSDDGSLCGKKGNKNYYFEPQEQSKHGCLFYGTTDTNKALERIADKFVERQRECKDNPDGDACKISYGGLLPKVSITGDPMAIRINAMSLPWGGVLDINRDWKEPHASHNDGRQADLSFGIFRHTSPSAASGVTCSDLRDIYDLSQSESFIAHEADRWKSICMHYDINRILLLGDVITKDKIENNFYRFPSFEGGDLIKTFLHGQPHFHIFFEK